MQPEFMPDRLESGTLNTPGLAGLAAAVRHVRAQTVAAIRAHELSLMTLFLDGLRNVPKVRVYGPLEAERRVGLVSLNVGSADPAQVALALETRHGIITRCGLHCAPWAHEVAGTLDRGAVRLSVGPSTTEDEIRAALAALRELAA